MNTKYALHTIDNLTNQASIYFKAGRTEDAIQLLNSATLILNTYDEDTSEFAKRLDTIHRIANNIVDITVKQFVADFERKFNCYE